MPHNTLALWRRGRLIDRIGDVDIGPRQLPPLINPGTGTPTSTTTSFTTSITPVQPTTTTRLRIPTLPPPETTFTAPIFIGNTSSTSTTPTTTSTSTTFTSTASTSALMTEISIASSSTVLGNNPTQPIPSADTSSITASNTSDLTKFSTTSIVSQSSDSTEIQSSTPTSSPSTSTPTSTSISTSTSLKPGIVAVIAIPSFLLIAGVIVLSIYFYRKHRAKKISSTNAIPWVPGPKFPADHKQPVESHSSTRAREWVHGQSSLNRDMDVVEIGSQVSYSTLPPPYRPGSERATPRNVDESSVEESERMKLLDVA